eukprot:CAMPEP_0174828132 /NCGR_PEP_ID=MMETSP1114-20130205/1154_1 /TAXON_ID=312471 /ORGANISM="Neobodo designis, Strain CCAP 1951/1" /LENGTH=108 /DNA_ID=CAMNT_0016061841 /DNA_START=41 /DNA_END=364 /DNA_ORIENTATION=+
MADESPQGKPEKQGPVITEVLPKSGLVYSEKSSMTELHCKPKIMPIKSAALERLEAMETEAKAVFQGAPQSRAGNVSGAPQSRSGRPMSARPTSAAGRLRSAAGSRPG